MSSLSIEKPNKVYNERRELINFLTSDNINEKIESLKVDWENRTVSNQSDSVEILTKYGLIKAEDSLQLTDYGLLIFGRITIDLQSEFEQGKILNNKYKIIESIKIGKNSATFISENEIFGKKQVLKIIRPGAATNILESLRVISGENAPKSLVQPIDYFELFSKDVFGKKVKLSCIVFPLIEGQTLRQFLSSLNSPISNFFIESFISQISESLAYLEDLDAYHGDLHEENIIVSVDTNGFLEFNIIDVSFGINGSLSPSESKNTDYKNFLHHLWKILNIQRTFLKKMSLRKYLGARTYLLVSQIISAESISFKEIQKTLKDRKSYTNYRKDKEYFINQKFSPPGGFKLLRYEEISSPQVAVELFEPFQELLQNIQEFGNSLISGHRGSGKSTYLASLAFFPSLNAPTVSPRDIFGIYFPCRQGEFKVFSPEVVNYENVGYSHPKHLLIIKIVRRSLEILCDAIDNNIFESPVDITKLSSSLKIFLPDFICFASDGSSNSKIKNLTSDISRIEMKEIDNLYGSEINKRRMANELDLINFFSAVKDTFQELVSTRFYILFDDAGEPNVPKRIQNLINELMLSSNPDFCIKFTAEKYSYDFESISGKHLEPSHDYVEHDISRTLLIGGGNQGINHEKLEKYFRKIIERRLEYLGYKSSSILDYVGDKQLPAETLVNLLSKSKRNAYYCGWTTIWNIADRTPRNLLEIVSEIFSVGNIDESSTPSIIKNREQDKAIRYISEKRLKSLSQISGKITVLGEDISLGRKLFEITSVIGAVYRIYLQSSSAKSRKDEYLAIERNDSSQLINIAEELLKKLVMFGVLDESRYEYSRDDKVKKPIYVLNRIFCPVFNISYRRDQHLRLSKTRFEEMLLSPMEFLKNGTSRLKEKKNNSSQIRDLFEDL